MHPILIFLLLITVFCAGCSSLNTGMHSTTIAEDRKFNAHLYQLYISKNGDLLNPESRNEVIYDGESEDEYISGEDEYISKIFENFEKQREKKKPNDLQLLIYVHGGLNTFNSATSRVNENTVNEMIADGKYPLFISWNAEGPSNYSDHLFSLRRGVMSGSRGPISSPFVFVEDITRSIVRLPTSIYNVLTNLHYKFQKESWQGKEIIAAKANLDKLKQDGQFKIHDSADEHLPFKDWWSIWNPLKLGTAPFVDEFGSGIWGSLLRRTDMVLHRDTSVSAMRDLDPDSENVLEKETAFETAASKFLTRWQEKYGKNKLENQQDGLEVVLVGHSMGTMITNNIVAKYQNINFSQIVYMAAACSIKEIEYVIAPYLKQNEKAVFYNLSLNPERDIMENVLYDTMPRGSLLVWIDQTLANINSFQDRTAGFWYNIIRSVDHIFDKEKGIRERVHLTMFGINDGSPQKHGDFDNCPYWKKKFWMGDLANEKCK